QALNNEDITIYGDGSQTRSFCYVDDLIEGFIKMMATDSKVIGPINLGNPGEFTIKELAEKILGMTKSKSEIIHKELPDDDPMRRKPDIGKAEKILDWNPKIDLNEGLRRTIAYFSSISS
ncbi:MAG: GDP-mannose 4,6-dehydratase, partial [Victivallales bacterium]|nr:GDP-mannose 4,6-dehydratase [Victivallales bacterium]